MKKIVTSGLMALPIVAAAALGYLALLHGDTTVPDGMYSSFEFIGHDRNDVLEFKDGTATLRTCCGDQTFGEYEHRPDGKWVWTYQFNNPHSYVLQRGKYSLTIEDGDGKREPLTMRRRLFKTIGL